MAILRARGDGRGKRDEGRRAWNGNLGAKVVCFDELSHGHGYLVLGPSDVAGAAGRDETTGKKYLFLQ